MENYLILMAAAAGGTVTHHIEPIFVHFFTYMGSHLGNDIGNLALQMLNSLWLVNITLSTAFWQATDINILAN